jgi:DNA polymerase-3 subunit epsilon
MTSQKTDIQCIAAKHTFNAPTFNKAWHQLAPSITNQNVVAHNGFGFDFTCLAQTLVYYNLPIPDYFKHCTYKIYKDNLANLCNKHLISLTHHDAPSDAEACGELFWRFLKM